MRRRFDDEIQANFLFVYLIRMCLCVWFAPTFMRNGIKCVLGVCATNSDNRHAIALNRAKQQNKSQENNIERNPYAHLKREKQLNRTN